MKNIETLIADTHQAIILPALVFLALGVVVLVSFLLSIMDFYFVSALIVGILGYGFGCFCFIIGKICYLKLSNKQ